MAQQRPAPVRGDWARRVANVGTVRFWFYSPSIGVEHRPPGRCTVRQGDFLGPVHEVQVTRQFVSIRVPYPEFPSLLVWVNIWSSRNHLGVLCGVAYCRVVPPQEHEHWVRRGWTDHFIDESDDHQFSELRSCTELSCCRGLHTTPLAGRPTYTHVP
jgi:hypothetical protein